MAKATKPKDTEPEGVTIDLAELAESLVYKGTVEELVEEIKLRVHEDLARLSSLGYAGHIIGNSVVDGEPVAAVNLRPRLKVEVKDLPVDSTEETGEQA